MKKITSRHSFDFNAGNGEVLAISPEGCLASDEAAKMVQTRFGGVVSVEDADIEAEVKKAGSDAGSEVKATTSMKRLDLEEMAKAHGASADDIEAAENKDALVALINTLISSKPAVEDAEKKPEDNA